MDLRHRGTFLILFLVYLAVAPSCHASSNDNRGDTPEAMPMPLGLSHQPQPPMRTTADNSATKESEGKEEVFRQPRDLSASKDEIRVDSFAIV